MGTGFGGKSQCQTKSRLWDSRARRISGHSAVSLHPTGPHFPAISRNPLPSFPPGLQTWTLECWTDASDWRGMRIACMPYGSSAYGMSYAPTVGGTHGVSEVSGCAPLALSPVSRDQTKATSLTGIWKLGHVATRPPAQRCTAHTALQCRIMGICVEREPCVCVTRMLEHKALLTTLQSGRCCRCCQGLELSAE